MVLIFLLIKSIKGCDLLTNLQMLSGAFFYSTKTANEHKNKMSNVATLLITASGNDHYCMVTVKHKILPEENSTTTNLHIATILHYMVFINCTKYLEYCWPKISGMGVSYYVSAQDSILLTSPKPTLVKKYMLLDICRIKLEGLYRLAAEIPGCYFMLCIAIDCGLQIMQYV